MDYMNVNFRKRVIDGVLISFLSVVKWKCNGGRRV